MSNWKQNVQSKPNFPRFLLIKRLRFAPSSDVLTLTSFRACCEHSANTNRKRQVFQRVTQVTSSWIRFVSGLISRGPLDLLSVLQNVSFSTAENIFSGLTWAASATPSPWLLESPSGQGDRVALAAYVNPLKMDYAGENETFSRRGGRSNGL